MSSSSSVLRFDGIDGWSWPYWLGVSLSIGIAAVNVFVGYVASEVPLFVVGCSFLLGVGLFFTRFWSPVFYLLGVLHVAVLGVIWILSGLQYFTAGLVNGLFSLGLAAIALYLFFEEERRVLD